jgi:hypothetical protein
MLSSMAPRGAESAHDRTMLAHDRTIAQPARR